MHMNEHVCTQFAAPSTNPGTMKKKTAIETYKPKPNEVSLIKHRVSYTIVIKQQKLLFFRHLVLYWFMTHVLKIFWRKLRFGEKNI